MAGDSQARLGGALPELVPGFRVGGYLLEEAIGHGGPAMVFRARDERLGALVALKLLRVEPGTESRFLAEGRAVAALDHPNILPVHDVGEAGGYVYLAMRLVAGGSLADIVRREGRLSPGPAMEFLSPVAAALDAVHRGGLVHRDVKPANILVHPQPSGPGHPYLSDFGVAANARAGGELTRPGTFTGTVDYASPEQISGGDVDGRADQYSLACVAYLLLVGSAPFGAVELRQVLDAHLHQDPPRLTTVRQDLPPAVDPVLAKALAKAPEDRYESCGDFASALSAALGLGRPADPRPADPWPAAEYDRSWEDRGSPGPAANQAPGSSGSHAPDSTGNHAPDSTGDQGSGPPANPGSGGGSPPRRYLHCRCQDVVLVGRPFSLLASITSDAVRTPRTGAALLPFTGPADVTLVLHAPGLRLLGDQHGTVRVPADGDSDPVRFELLADTEGSWTISVTAWLGGSCLGELVIDVTADRDRTVGLHREYRSEIDPAPAEGAPSAW